MGPNANTGIHAGSAGDAPRLDRSIPSSPSGVSSPRRLLLDARVRGHDGERVRDNARFRRIGLTGFSWARRLGRAFPSARIQ